MSQHQAAAAAAAPSLKNDRENNAIRKKKSKRSKKTDDENGEITSSTSKTTNTTTIGACDHVSQRYEKVARVGQGTYGVVYKARDRQENGRFVALKRCIPHHESSDGFPLTTLREIHALRTCSSHHANIVSLLQVAVSDGGVFLVFEYAPQDLAQVLDSYYHKYHKSPFKESQVKTLVKQLLSALEFVHAHYLLHRDIKLSNLLYTVEGKLLLADFGLSRHTPASTERALTANVVSLWYRPPELLLEKNNTSYTSKIDLWAVGCVFGELLQGFPLLDGRDELEQISKLISCLGHPSPKLYPHANAIISGISGGKSNTHYKSSSREQPLLDSFSYLSNHGLRLLTQLVNYNPKTRWSASQALSSSYFKEAPLPATATDMRTVF
jgi:serine/threonine protein kinase